ncbi:hypothetical protein AM500_17055 [Bacillus sp. FJAT-18017]|uniref:DUF4395 domain-containing protein n=1 Tax=Bacillus sp. FJAT-18017 TaxID=1705566 RepID=UPI0006AFBC08|nr:DUF4395 domain-containing protein [Bacillus sp. FJAT-18017]ALC91315.1 hypothetical protein AM500_17055 [Bacillus sp. FJAT-18017]
MAETVRSIPRPLVRTNQWVIVLSVVATWITGEEWNLAIPLVAGLMGLFFGFNPIMKVARQFLKKEPSAYIPEEWNQQQFNQGISVVCLAGGLAGYAFGWNTLGHAFTIMVAIAAFVAILGFCIGCFIRFQYIQWRTKKRIGNQN